MKIKILHIQLLPLLSGVQNMMLALLNSLDKCKYEIYVICKPGGPLVDKIIESGFNYIPLKSLRREISVLDLVSFFGMIRIFRKYKIDIVHTHSSKTGFLGRIAARMCRIPKIIHTVHGFAFHQFQHKFVQIFYMTMERIAAVFCDKVVFVNAFERQLAISRKIVSFRKALTIYNGVQLPKKAKFSEIKEEFIIGSVARFSKQKNIINVINIAIKVCRNNKKIKFIFIGDGELFGICQRSVKDSGLSNRIQLVGWQRNIAEWLEKFDVFLLFSKWEGLSISILEAMASGLPIIASDIKGNNELVSDKNGILIPINREDVLEDELNKLPSRTEELKKWGRGSRKIVERKFSLSNFVEKYEQLYES